MVTRPQGQLPWHTLVQELVNEFRFSKVPQEYNGSSLTFSDGSYQDNAIETLSIEQDGFVLKSKSPTAFLEQITQHLKTWITKKLGFTIVETNEINKFYKSILTIHTSKPILAFLDKFSAITSTLENEILTASKYQPNFQPFGISFGVDTQKSLIKPSNFILERKAGTEYSFNNYFSAAPLSTEAHLRVLEQIEKLC